LGSTKIQKKQCARLQRNAPQFLKVSRHLINDKF
jgi:hypothetical protein